MALINVLLVSCHATLFRTEKDMKEEWHRLLSFSSTLRNQPTEDDSKKEKVSAVLRSWKIQAISKQI
jgi:hypothetical protein